MSGSFDRPVGHGTRGKGRPDPAAPASGARAAELTRLTAALSQMLAGSGRLVLLSGEPGSGKTHLAEALASEARAAGATVVWGKCWAGDGAPELWPWRQVMRSCLRAVDDQTLPALVGPHGSDLTALLAPLRPGTDDLSPAGGPAARFRQFNAIAHFLEAYAARVPLVVILEDLHRADPPSLLLLQFLAQEQRERRLLTIGTYRAPGAAANRALTESVLEASREPGTERIALATLGDDEIAALAAPLLGRPPAADRVAALREWTGGNPLLLIECLRAAGDAGAEPGLPIPTELRALLEQRLAPLSVGERATLARAAALGVEFDAAAVANPGEGTETQVGAALAAARELGLLKAGTRAGSARFTHGLLRALLGEWTASGAPAAAPAPVGAQTAAAPDAAAPPARGGIFRREGEYWTIDFAGRTCRVRDAKGLGYVALLLRHPGQSLHVTELVSRGNGEAGDPAVFRREPSTTVRRGLGDGGVVLDGQAKAAYRRRLAELDAELTEARTFNDGARVERAQQEMEALRDELSAAVGLGGRDRRIGSDVERARVNITRAIARAVENIAEHHPELAQHLGRCVRTGTFCSYVPDLAGAAGWVT